MNSLSNIKPIHQKLIPWLKANWPLLLLFVVIIFAGFRESGHRREKREIRKQRQELIEQRQSLEDSLKVVRQNYQIELDSIKALKAQKNEYYERYVQEYNKRRRIESALRGVADLQFGRSTLDSLANYYIFE